MADDTIATHPDGCKQSQLSEPEVAHDAIEVVIVDHDAIEVGIHNDCVAEERPAAEPLETKHNKILRFPSNLRRIGAERDYIAPRTVALGPYYHGVPELQAIEVIKHSAVDYFFERLATPREEIYKEFIPIARAARSCYVDVSAFAGITDDEFFSMMFVDAIFLVQFIGSLGSDHRLDSMVSPYLVDILRDILLLENQIPWLVTHFFMALWPLSLDVMIGTLMVSMTGSFLEEPPEVDLGESYMPSHLLCLIRTYRAGRSGRRPIVEPKRLCGRKNTTSAAELTQMGIKLRVGKTTAKFSDMDLVRGHFFVDLSLQPLYLDSTTACWLVNMAALETYTENFMTGPGRLLHHLIPYLRLDPDEPGAGRARAARQGHRGWFQRQTDARVLRGPVPLSDPRPRLL